MARSGIRVPLAVTVAPGMAIFETTTAAMGTIVGFTQAYCIYRVDHLDELSVAPWPDMALPNICPAAPLLPQELADNDLANARAALLREFLSVKHHGFTPTQSAALEELIGMLSAIRAS